MFNDRSRLWYNTFYNKVLSWTIVRMRVVQLARPLSCISNRRRHSDRPQSFNEIPKSFGKSPDILLSVLFLIEPLVLGKMKRF